MIDKASQPHCYNAEQWSSQDYWREVKRIARMAARDAEQGGDIYAHADEYVEDSPWLSSHTQKVVAYSKHPDAFAEWEPGDVEEGSDTWWWTRAFYAISQDVYSVLKGESPSTGTGTGKPKGKPLR